MTTNTETSLGEAQAQRLEKVGEGLKTLFDQPAVAQRWHAAQSNEVWSAMQTLGHMTEMFPYWLHHCQALIAAAEPPQFGRGLDAPERLAGVERGATANPDDMLRQLNDEIQTTANAIRNMSDAECGKKGLHVRRGEMTVADVIDFFIVSHAEEHLEQVRVALQS
jgi:uncharacterized damage-inducible protein DinB